MANNIKLKPCPFCGEEAFLEETPSGKYEVFAEHGWCYLGQLPQSFDTAEEAVQKWNFRRRRRREVW